MIFGFPSSFLPQFTVSFLFHGKQAPLIQIWQWRDFLGPKSLLHIATNQIASFWIGNRLSQIAIFRFCVKVVRVMFFFSFKTSRFHVAVCRVCSVIDHKRRQNVVRTLVALSAIAAWPTFLHGYTREVWRLRENRKLLFEAQPKATLDQR